MTLHPSDTVFVKLSTVDANAFQDTRNPTTSSGESLLTDVLAHLPGVVYRASVTPTTHQIQLLFVNSEVERLLGLTVAAVMAQTDGWMAFVHPDDRATVHASISRAIQTLVPVTHTYRILTSTGQAKWVQERVQVSYAESGLLMLYGMVLEMGDRQQVEPIRQAIDCEQQRVAIARFTALMTQHIHQATHLDDAFHHLISELRYFLQLDRVVLVQQTEVDRIQLRAQSVASAWPIQEPLLIMAHAEDWTEWMTCLSQGQIQQVDDLENSTLPEPIRADLSAQNVCSGIIAPIWSKNRLWGAIVLQQCTQHRVWDVSEAELVKHVTLQLGIVIGQWELHQELQKANTELERKYQLQNAQLKLAFEFEATLKRITDKVRDSLDENQILQTAVQELTTAIGVSGCNAAIYDLEQGTSTICYEYTTTGLPYQGRVAQISAFPELYNQLFRGIAFQFCSIVPNPVRGSVSLLACPIWDDQGILGDLWLINHKFYAFTEQDIRLVQQVANQCAIALRQARLYQAAQSQVAELERLNQLKDDFLSTVSHELRTPIASIKLASQMLSLTLNRAGLLSESDSIASRYLKILQSECDREINLVNDLLDLSRLESEAEPLCLESVGLADWIKELTKPFMERSAKQKQRFTTSLLTRLPRVLVDIRKLDRVVTELLNNACKYTPPHEQIKLTLGLSSGVLQISVINSGVEIPVQERSRIFERFYRIPNTDPWKHGGTGLGLALVKKLIEQLDGTIGVLSQDGATTFVVEVPIQDGAAML